LNSLSKLKPLVHKECIGIATFENRFRSDIYSVQLHRDAKIAGDISFQTRQNGIVLQKIELRRSFQLDRRVEDDVRRITVENCLMRKQKSWKKVDSKVQI
jgi:hypothetical protein